jgi:hypothetical protein
MKTPQLILTLVFVAALALGAGWFLRGYYAEETEPAIDEPAATNTPVVQIPVPEEESITLPDLDGLLLNIPESSETATVLRTNDTGAGDSLYSATFGENENGFVAVIDNRLTAINEDTFVVPFAVSTGGSGTFSYLGLLAQAENTLQHVDSYLLGDRIRILDTNADTDTGIVAVTVLDRHADQSMTDDPAHEVVMTFMSQDNSLVLQTTHRNVNPSDVSATAVVDEDTVLVTGAAPESWFFEGDFPVEIVGDDLTVLETGFVTRTTPLDYENPSTSPVPFEGTLSDIVLEEGERYYLRLTRDNVSDDRSLDASALLQI